MGTGNSYRRSVALAGNLSQPTETVRIVGLAETVEILVDQWGVPHLYAANEEDLFFTQGFNVARERLFQLDLWRRRGLGLLSEAFGPDFVEQDTAARLFLYRGDLTAEWSRYGEDVKGIAGAFVAGINAYLEWLEKHPDRMPIEFQRLGYTPARWNPEDVVRIRSHGLTRNIHSEVERARTMCKADLASDSVRVGLQPPCQVVAPEGLDPCLPDDVLRLFSLATREVRLTRATLENVERDSDVSTLTSSDAQEAKGSNNWVIAPWKSGTGRPQLANDPHRELSIPSLRYIAHLSAPGLDVIGAGEPAIPGISIGHNGAIAFGVAIFPIDQEDLYVYRLHPVDDGRYRYGDEWEEMKVVHESLPVKGGGTVPVEMRFTRHGPVIRTDTEKRRAFAVRSCWLEPGTSPYLGSIGCMRARNFRQFREAVGRWGAPAENLVYADVEGNIGCVSGGLAPIRPNWDGLLPVPGDGRYEWSGFLDGEALPCSYNPPEGWLATANQVNLPPGFAHRVGFEWVNGSRYDRIAEVLGAPGKVSLEDSMRLQNDVYSIPARRLARLLAPLQADDAMTETALEYLRHWNFELHPDSGEAALSEVWLTRHLRTGFKQEVLTKEAAATFARANLAVMLDILERPQGRLEPRATERRDTFLLSTLRAAWSDTEKLLGSDPSRWKWGSLHHSVLEHPMSQIADEGLSSQLNVGPLPKGGSAYTPNKSTYRPSDFQGFSGASFRVVVDVGNWDNSRAVNHPGQSGDPRSPHYRDLAPLWLRGDYFPLLYSRPAVEAAARQWIRLVPHGRREPQDA